MLGGGTVGGGGRLHAGKVIKAITAEGKVIMRLPSIGGKVIKMLT